MFHLFLALNYKKSAGILEVQQWGKSHCLFLIIIAVNLKTVTLKNNMEDVGGGLPWKDIQRTPLNQKGFLFCFLSRNEMQDPKA